jgi:ParB-like chromosome segregation protein Spo0J
MFPEPLEDAFTIEAKDTGGILIIDINSLVLNPFQPCIHRDKEKIKELADSIKSQGLLQPIRVIKEWGV